MLVNYVDLTIINNYTMKTEVKIMEESILDNLYICDLYQIDKEIGYLTKGNIEIN